MGAYARGVQRRQKAQVATATGATGLLDTGYGIGTSEYMRSRGGYGVTLECGQHDDAEAVGVAYRAIRQTLALLGLASLALTPPSSDFQVLRLVDVVDREYEDDRFSQPWKSFDAVVAGQTIGQRHDGRLVTAPDDGFVVFPNPNAPTGNEWFYFAQKSGRVIS
jgi:succinylglutamate desuccinylase